MDELYINYITIKLLETDTQISIHSKIILQK